MTPEHLESVYVVAWLRGQPQHKSHGKWTKASRKRILDLIAVFEELISGIAALVPSYRPEDDLPGIDELALELNQRLGLYATTPTFNLFDRKSWGVANQLDTYKHIPVGESLAAHTVIALAHANRLDRVRECLCGEWFYAIRSDQRSCSASCRQARHQQTENCKAKRREYMRSYYRLKQSGKVK